MITGARVGDAVDVAPPRGEHPRVNAAPEPPPAARARSAALITDPLFLAHEAAGHAERPARLTAILDHLERSGLRARMRDLPARDATDDEILAVHDRALLDEEARVAARNGWMDPDTYVNPASPAIARRAAGAVLAGLEAVLAGEVESAFAAVRPPGHHATGGRAMGFCLLNNVAIAAAAALRVGLERVGILDWDVHHGNGTQAIFDAEPRVFYASTHAYPFYPGSGHFRERGVGAAAGTKLNVPLPHGAGDRAITAAYERLILPALARFRPQLIIVSCGWDAHARDPLATLEVTTDGYARVMRTALDAARALCGGRVVLALEGGYDLHALAWCAGTLCALLLGEEPAADPEPASPLPEPDVEALFAAIAATVEG